MSGKIAGMVWDIELPRPEMFVLLALADHCDHEGKDCFPGLSLLSWKTCYDESQVKRLLKSLRDMGIIRPTDDRLGGRGNKTGWEIHLENGKQKPPRERGASGTKGRMAQQTENPKGAHGAQQRGASDTVKGRISEELPSKERARVNQRRTKEEPKDTPEDLRRAPFIQFVMDEYRTAREGDELDVDGRDFKELKALLKRTANSAAYRLDELCARWKRFLADPDTFVRKQRPLQYFCSHINAYSSTGVLTANGRKQTRSEILDEATENILRRCKMDADLLGDDGHA